MEKSLLAPGNDALLSTGPKLPMDPEVSFALALLGGVTGAMLVLSRRVKRERAAIAYLNGR